MFLLNPGDNMDFSQKMLLMFSPLQLISIFVSIFVLIAVSGSIITRRLVSNARLKMHNDFIGPVFGVMGTIYAVMLAFVVVITWESHDATKQHIDREVSGLVSLFAESECFKEPMRSEVRKAVLDYAEAVVNSEWNGLKTGVSTPFTDTKLYNAMKLYGSYEPATKAEEVCLAKSVDKLSDVIELRRMRQLDSRNGIHPILWLTLIAGGIITVLMSCIFGAESFSLQMITTISLACIIAIVLFTIVELDHPFTGKIGLSPAAFQEIVARLKVYLT
jgi:hypothetical protein